MSHESRTQADGADQAKRDRFFSLSPDLLCIADFSGFFRDVSPAWENLLGYTRAELLGRPFVEFIHPEDVGETLTRFRYLVAGTDVIDFENRYRRQDGDYVRLEWRCTSSTDEQLIYAIARDVTEQRELRRALADARLFSERIADVLPSVLYVYDFNEQRNIFINRQVTTSLGLPSDYFERLGGRGIPSVMHPEDWPRFVAHNDSVRSLPDGQVRELTYRMKHASGEWRWFHSRDAVFARNSDGSVRQFIGTATDVTAIKNAEESLRESKQRLDFALSAANMGVWEINLQTGAATWTEPVARILGLGAQQAPRNLEEFLALVHPEDRERQRQCFEEALASGSLYRSEFRQNLPEDQLRWVAGLGKFIYDADGQPIRLLGLAWDITSQKRAEASRLRLESQLRQSQKMEALGTLAGGIAHDFNNVLTAISGNARIALQDLSAEHPSYVSVEEVLRGAKRAGDLVRRILAFSRNDEPALRPTDLRAVVDEAVRLLRATIPAAIEIKFDAPGQAPAVLADETQILQVILNLGANARDAMNTHGGRITISLREEPIDKMLASAARSFSGTSCARLRVQDSGSGMSPEVLERAFEPFFTTKGQGRGTGMGLAVVHGIVRSHNGVILASSEPGRGSTFDIYLPSTEQDAKAVAEPTSASTITGRGERVLYVDDEEALVFLATRMLNKMGFTAEGRTDVRQALHEFQSDSMRYDIVITDLGMPGIDGLDFAAELRRIRPSIPIIVTSGYVRPEDVDRAQRVGADSIVLKPSTVEEMAELIAERLSAVAGRRDDYRRRT